MAKDKLSSEDAFKRMIGATSAQQNDAPAEPASVTPVIAAPVAAPVMTEPQQALSALSSKQKSDDADPHKQISLYLRVSQIMALNLQAAVKIKETDKSAIIRFGADIALDLPDEDYLKLKAAAQMAGKSPGEIVQDALRLYFAS